MKGKITASDQTEVREWWADKHSLFTSESSCMRMYPVSTIHVREVLPGEEKQREEIRCELEALRPLKAQIVELKKLGQSIQFAIETMVAKIAELEESLARMSTIAASVKPDYSKPHICNGKMELELENQELRAKIAELERELAEQDKTLAHARCRTPHDEDYLREVRARQEKAQEQRDEAAFEKWLGRMLEVEACPRAAWLASRAEMRKEQK